MAPTEPCILRSWKKEEEREKMEKKDGDGG